MKTHIWEDQKLFNINKELQQLIESKTIKNVISMSVVSVDDPKNSMPLYSAILIYK